MGRLFKELQRRNVIRAGVTYVVAAWVVLQVVDLLAPALEWSDSATRVTLYALLIGFPIAMLLSWFYQITPDGISLDEDSDQASPGSQAVDQRLNQIVIALLAAAVILFAYDKWWPDEITDPSIAVLPFANMSGLEENEYFADGLTENLLHVLARNKALRVAARTSSFAFKNKDIDIREIAGELGVAHILEGSVQAAGGEIRVTAQLIRASDGTHLWSAKYDRRLDDIFAIQDEIAATVAARLSGSLLSIEDLEIPESVATHDIEAFDLYLRARAESLVGSFESTRNAEEFLKSALVKDPGFTDAKALLAQVYVNLADTGAMDFDVGIAQGKTFFEQVLIEQPGHAGARAFFLIYETVEATNSGDIAARATVLESFTELIDDAPNDVGARMSFAMMLMHNSMFDESIEQFHHAIELDPLNPEPPRFLALVHNRNQQWDVARQYLERSLEIEPRQPNVLAELADIARKTGDAVAYVRYAQRAIELDPLDYEMPHMIAVFLYELELVDEGDYFQSQVTAIAPDSPAALSMEIVRSIRVDSEDQSLALARQFMRDDVDNRRQAWLRAFHHLMLTAVRNGRTRDELDFVLEYVPDFANWDIPPSPWKVGLARAQTLEIWRDLDTEQGMQERLDKVESGFASINLPMSRVEIVLIDVLLLRDDLEGAIDAALTHLYSDSVLGHLNIKDRFRTPLYADFVADPRIVAAIENWDKELAQAGADVRQYLVAENSPQ